MRSAALALLLVGCSVHAGKGSAPAPAPMPGDPSPVPGTPAPAPSSPVGLLTTANLAGTWATVCRESVDLDAPYGAAFYGTIERYLTFSGNAFHLVVAGYKDAHCAPASAGILLTIDGTYAIGGAAADMGSQLTFTYTSVSLLPTTDEAAAGLNADKGYCGKKDFTKGKALDLLKTPCADAMLDGGLVPFDLGDLENGKLTLGSYYQDQLDGSTADKRPTKWSLNEELTPTKATPPSASAPVPPPPAQPTTPPPPPPPARSVIGLAVDDDGCALLSDHTVSCWKQSTPTQAAVVMTDAVSLVKEYFGTCIVTTGGAAQCLDINLANLKTVIPSGVKSIAIGQGHACALMTDGGVKCWGENGSGQIGTGSVSTAAVQGQSTSIDTPTGVAGIGGPASQVVVSDDFSCAVLTAGGIKCWGSDFANLNGSAGTIPVLKPTTIPGLPGPFTQVAAAGDDLCVILPGGHAQCVGNGDFGSLGNGATWSRTIPTDVIGLESGTTQVSGHGWDWCGLHGGQVSCWGPWNGDVATPAAVTGLAGPATLLATGNSRACALLTTGQVQCWDWQKTVTTLNF